MGDPSTTNIDPVTVVRGPVTVVRRLDLQPSGVVAVVTLRSEKPVTVSVIDYLPGNWPVDEAGFHEDAEPDEGAVGDTSVAFDVAVSPTEERTVVYGLVLGESIDRAGIEEAQTFSTPHIDRIEDIDSNTEGRSEAEDVERSRKPASRIDRSPEPRDGRSVADDDSTADDLEELFEKESTPSQTSESPVAALAEEIATGRADDRHLETLREALADGSDRESGPRSRDVDSRRDAFETYVDGLRKLFDERETASELEETIAVLEGEVDDVWDVLETVGDDQSGLEDSIDGVRTSLEEVAAQVDHLEDVVDGQGDRFSGLSADVESIQSDVASLQDRVDYWDAFRGRLLDALDPPENG